MKLVGFSPEAVLSCLPSCLKSFPVGWSALISGNYCIPSSHQSPCRGRHDGLRFLRVFAGPAFPEAFLGLMLLWLI